MTDATTTATTHRELMLTRTIAAPRQLVWDAYTIPEQVAAWWGPARLRTPLETITLDLRPGGAFRLTMVSDIDGATYPSEMTFREVVPMERLVFGWDSQGSGIATGGITITLAEVADGTLLVHHFVGHITDEVFPMMEQGTREELDKLNAMLIATVRDRAADAG